VDLVDRMRSRDGEEFLLHAEIANNNSTDMPLRMLRYYTDICFSGRRGPIRQFLIIYIGSERLTMPAGLDEPGLLDYHYGLVDRHTGSIAPACWHGTTLMPWCWPCYATSVTETRGRWLFTSCVVYGSCWVRMSVGSAST